MSQTSRPTRLAAAQRREAILDATLAILSEQGYEGTSVRDIAAAVGVSVPVLYDHFPSKTALQLALIEREGAALLSHARRQGEAGSWAELVRSSIDAFFAFVEDRPHSWRLIFVEVPADPKLAAAQDQVLADATRATTGMIAAIPAWELSRPIARELADSMLAEGVRSALTGLARWWWRHRDTPREDVVTIAYDLLYTGLDRLCQAPWPPSSSSPMGDDA
ncbi:MAG: TetR/AcrR family transcriptional regulator [Solirubrobacteraceae bacterium]